MNLIQIYEGRNPKSEKLELLKLAAEQAADAAESGDGRSDLFGVAMEAFV